MKRKKWVRIFRRKIQAKDKQKDLVEQKQLYFINAVVTSKKMKIAISILSLVFSLLAIISQFCDADKNITIILLWITVLLINQKNR